MQVPKPELLRGTASLSANTCTGLSCPQAPNIPNNLQSGNSIPFPVQESKPGKLFHGTAVRPVPLGFNLTNAQNARQNVARQTAGRSLYLFQAAASLCRPAGPSLTRHLEQIQAIPSIRQTLRQVKR